MSKNRLYDLKTAQNAQNGRNGRHVPGGRHVHHQPGEPIASIECLLGHYWPSFVPGANETVFRTTSSALLTRLAATPSLSSALLYHSKRRRASPNIVFAGDVATGFTALATIASCCRRPFPEPSLRCSLSPVPFLSRHGLLKLASGTALSLRLTPE
jgi:hypothetical protein